MDESLAVFFITLQVLGNEQNQLRKEGERGGRERGEGERGEREGGEEGERGGRERGERREREEGERGGRGGRERREREEGEMGGERREREGREGGERGEREKVCRCDQCSCSVPGLSHCTTLTSAFLYCIPYAYYRFRGENEDPEVLTFMKQMERMPPATSTRYSCSNMHVSTFFLSSASLAGESGVSSPPPPSTSPLTAALEGESI